MPAPPGPPPIVAAVYCGPPGGAPSETTAWGRSHFFRPTPGLSYPNPSPAVAAASSSTPIVCMELLQLPDSSRPARGPSFRSDDRGERFIKHPDFHCDRLGHGRVKAHLLKLQRWASRPIFQPVRADSAGPRPRRITSQIQPLRRTCVPVTVPDGGAAATLGDCLPDLRLMTLSDYDRAFLSLP